MAAQPQVADCHDVKGLVTATGRKRNIAFPYSGHSQGVATVGISGLYYPAFTGAFEADQHPHEHQQGPDIELGLGPAVIVEAARAAIYVPLPSPRNRAEGGPPSE